MHCQSAFSRGETWNREGLLWADSTRSDACWTPNTQCPLTAAEILCVTRAGDITFRCVEHVGVHELIPAEALVTIFRPSNAISLSCAVGNAGRVGHVRVRCRQLDILKGPSLVVLVAADI
jgi:hypothetical protein